MWKAALAGAIALSVALLAGSWLIYDALWSSPLGRRQVPASLLSFGAGCLKENKGESDVT